MTPPTGNTSGFTLIELMVVISIIGILFVGSYIPYDYYSRLSKVRISLEKVHQSMENARIFAQNGQIFPGTNRNADVWLLIEKGAHDIKMFASIPWTHPFSEGPNAKIIKIISLEDDINITNIPENALLIEYKAPKWEMIIYKSPTETGAVFDIGIGWGTTEDGPLYKTLKVEE